MATILLKDIYKRVTRRIDGPEKELIAIRATIVVILGIAAFVAATVPSSTINDLGFLSMGLRGTVVFLPMNCALWFSGKIDRRCILASILLAPLAVLAGKLLALPFDSLFLGMAVSLLCCAARRLMLGPTTHV